MQTWKMLLVMKNINWAIKQFFLNQNCHFFFPSKSRFMFDYHCRILCGVSQNLPCHGNVPSFPGEIMSPKRIQISKNRWLDSLKIKKTACVILQLRDIFLFILFCFVFYRSLWKILTARNEALMKVTQAFGWSYSTRLSRLSQAWLLNETVSDHLVFAARFCVDTN